MSQEKSCWSNNRKSWFWPCYCCERDVGGPILHKHMSPFGKRYAWSLFLGRFWLELPIFLCPMHFTSHVRTLLNFSDLGSTNLASKTLFLAKDFVLYCVHCSHFEPSSVVPSSLVHKVWHKSTNSQLKILFKETQFFTLHLDTAIIFLVPLCIQKLHKITDPIFLKLFPGNFGIVWSARMQTEFNNELTVAVKKMKGKHFSLGYVFETNHLTYKQHLHFWSF